jgi:hypothetical protein
MLFFALMGVTMAWGFTLLLSVIFFSAVFSPGHQLVITVNEFKEMVVECVMFPTLLATSTWALFYMWRRYKRGEF